MNMADVKVKIPKSKPEDLTNITGGEIGISPKEAKARFEKIDNLLFGIIASVVISGVAVVVAVVGLFIDQMRYNNAAYQDYSDKTKSVEQTIKSNETILKQTELQQKQIIELQSNCSTPIK